MPEEEYVWLPRSRHPRLRGDRSAGRRLHGPRRRPGAADRRRAAAAPRPAAARPAPRGETALRDLALTTNGVLLAEQARGAPGGGAPPGHGQPRHAPARPLPRADAVRRARASARRASTRPRGSVSPRSRSTPSSCAASTTTSSCRSSSTAGASAPRCASSSTWTSAARRAGRGTRSSRGARSSTRLERHYGPIEPIVEESSAPADRFRLPDGTVFGIISSTTAPFCAFLRPQPADGRRHLVPLPLRAERESTCAGRCARAPPRRSFARASSRAGARGPIAAPRSGSRSTDRAPLFQPARCARIRTSRCTRGAAEARGRSAIRTPTQPRNPFPG